MSIWDLLKGKSGLKVDFSGLLEDAKRELELELVDLRPELKESGGVVEKALSDLLRANLELLGSGGNTGVRKRALRNVLHVKGILVSEAAYRQIRLYGRVQRLVKSVLEKGLVQLGLKVWDSTG